MLITRLLLVLEVWEPLLQGQINQLITPLLVLEVWDDKPTMGWESSGVVGFDLGPLLQGQMRIAKLKSAYNSLIIDPRGLGW